jgi:hypothetical protein
MESMNYAPPAATSTTVYFYFFHGGNEAVLTHALTKEDVVPTMELERALDRKAEFERDPEAHT